MNKEKALKTIRDYIAKHKIGIKLNRTNIYQDKWFPEMFANYKTIDSFSFRRDWFLQPFDFIKSKKACDKFIIDCEKELMYLFLEQ